MRKGLASGRTLPREVLAGDEQTIAPHVVDDPGQSELAWPFARIPASFPEADRERIARDGLAAIRDSVVPGFRDFLEFMRDEYIPRARPTLGVTALPDGAAFYRHRIRMHTTLELAPEQVHAMGLREVARLRQDMLAVARRAGFGGTLAGVRRAPAQRAASLRSDVRRLPERGGALGQADGRRAAAAVLPAPTHAVRDPRHAAARRAADVRRLLRPRRGRRQQGRPMNINTSDLPARPLYVAPVLAFHEGVPGHHLQIMLVRENVASPSSAASSGLRRSPRAGRSTRSSSARMQD